MKVCFVGIHHKEGKTPLDSSTKTGMIIDRVIENVGAKCQFEKKNLFPTYTLPSKDFRDRISSRFNVQNGVLYVLLGNVVRDHFPAQWINSILKARHPGFVMRRGELSVDEYVENLTKSILERHRLFHQTEQP